MWLFVHARTLRGLTPDNVEEEMSRKCQQAPFNGCTLSNIKGTPAGMAGILPQDCRLLQCLHQATTSLHTFATLTAIKSWTMYKKALKLTHATMLSKVACIITFEGSVDTTELMAPAVNRILLRGRCACNDSMDAGRCAGKPKGVMLTHAAMVSEVASITTFLQEGEIACGEGDSILSYLTLAHILDRVVEDFLLSAGGCIGYWQVMLCLQPCLFSLKSWLLFVIVEGC